MKISNIKEGGGKALGTLHIAFPTKLENKRLSGTEYTLTLLLLASRRSKVNYEYVTDYNTEDERWDDLILAVQTVREYSTVVYISRMRSWGYSIEL